MGKPRRASKDDELHSAARSGDLSAVQTILGSDPLAVNSRDKHSRTPLHLAAWSGQSEVVTYLCKNRADVGAAAMDDMAAIHFAAQKGHLEVVRILLSSGASVKSLTRKGFTPLHYAVQGSYMDLIKYLVKKGANLSAKTKAGKTPLDLTGNEEIRAYLEECESKAESKKDDPTPDGESKAESPNQKSSNLDESAETSQPKKESEEKDLKRKGDEGSSMEAVEEPKKKKVMLSHLVTADYEDEEAE